jgi:hypothetical protein
MRGKDEVYCGIQLVELFLLDCDGRERLRVPETSDQLMEWAAKSLPEVCLLVVS